MTQPNEERPEFYAAVALLVFVVFSLDTLTSLGTATGVLYFVPLTLSLNWWRWGAP